MARVYVGGLKAETTERDLEDEFSRYGVIRTIWVARKPPGFAFVEFEDNRDAEDAVRKGDGVKGWRVELSKRPPAGGRKDRDRDSYDRAPARSGRGELRCYECNEVGHLARDCRNRGGRGRSPPRRRDYSPRRRDYSPRRRDDSPQRRRDDSRGRRDDSPPRRRDDSPRRRDDSPPRHRDETPPRRDDDSPREHRDSPERRRESPPAEEHRHEDSPPGRISRSPAADENGHDRPDSASPRRDRSPARRSRSRSRSRS